MAWIYLADTEVSPSLSQSGLDQSLTVRSSTTLKEYFSQGCLKDNYPMRLSGTTLTPSLQKSSKEKSILSTEDSHARTSVLQEMERAWQESEADFSSNCVNWSKKSSPLSSSWKTSQPLGLEVFEKSSVNLQIWGMTVDGLVYLPQRLEPCTVGKGGSYWPTPTASDYRRRGPNSKQQGLPNAVGRGSLNPQWVEWLMGVSIGWTELKPWAMEWFRSRRKKRS